MREKVTWADVLIHVILTLFILSIILTFVHMLVLSFSPGYVATKGGLHLWPEDPTLDNYTKVLGSKYIWLGYKNTIMRTIVGTSLSLFITAMGAYALSKAYFPHRSFWTLLIVFTMFFSGGLIPNYLLIKNLGLLDRFASMILPGLVSAYNLVIMRNYFQSLPEEIEESCMIDGAGRFRTFISVVLPLSTPILATVALWLAVGHWNAWFDVLIYMTDETRFTLQVVLRRILITGTQQMLESTSTEELNEYIKASPEGLKGAAIFVATLPILCAYPFVQRYFVKGIMVGSLKG